MGEENLWSEYFEAASEEISECSSKEELRETLESIRDDLIDIRDSDDGGHQLSLKR